VVDCPNCGQQVDESAALCPNCGFDIHSRLADEVRRLREQGKIHPGRIGVEDENEFTGPEPRGGSRSELPAEDTPLGNPEQSDAGM
jgi:NMD protein affecting ribosome stability and mRNA decay